MGVEEFPEMESFSRLPRKVIVKGGSATVSEREGAHLTGIVINNTGHPIRNVKANVVIFNEKGLPALNASTAADPQMLQQGAVGAFAFRFQDYTQPIANYHLYADWRFDDRPSH